MSQHSGFSWTSVVFSYFLVAGGIAIGLILLVLMKAHGEALFYLSLALGGAIGGFAAGRASRGTTITEPAIGGVLVVLTFVGVFVGSDVGHFIWSVASSDITRLVLIAGGAAAAGAVGGAFVAERMIQGHSQHGLVWLAHVALAVLGASIVALLVVMAMIVRGETDAGTAGGAYIGAVAAGSLLSGIAAGASAPRRLLLISWLATVVGTMGFYLLMTALPGARDDKGDAAIGFVVLGVGFGLLTMLGALIGWKLVGQKQAQVAPTAVFE